MTDEALQSEQPAQTEPSEQVEQAEPSEPAERPQPVLGVDRPSWDEYFMTLANQVATRTTCLRRAVGCVIVKDKRILATGYNGVPTGLRHCAETGCLREQLGIPSGHRHEICRGLHAEQNAIIQAARYGTDIRGATIYVNTQPCVVCAKMLINAGIEEIVYQNPYPDELSMELLGEAGIKMRVFEG
ncbi:MAG: cytidine/deoxycytidylate deaminase family protein [Eggerthellaceae bacterium]|nr:cytidine/deoxycytidylate deaminase family protein [Eggerthellaceae bacterium]